MKETNPDATPLYSMNPLQRFSDRATVYAQYRPSYPAAAIDSILEGLGVAQELVAADIGAGTGISSSLLALCGVSVIAIEPNPAMRQAANPAVLVEFRDGTAEATNLPDASVDLVTCFQAFHWFEPESCLQEFRRILKHKGRLALVWNDRAKDDEFTANYTRLVQIASNNHPAESRLVAVEPLLASPHFANIRCHTFAYQQELDLSGLIGRAESVSYVPRSGLAHQQLVSDLLHLHSRFANEHSLVYLLYHTTVYLAEPIYSRMR